MPAAVCPGETRPDASGAVADSVDAMAAEGWFHFPGRRVCLATPPNSTGTGNSGLELQALCGRYRRIRDPRPVDRPGGAGGWAHGPTCRPYRGSGSRCLRDPEPPRPAWQQPGGRHTKGPGAGPEARRWPHRSRRGRARPRSKGGGQADLPKPSETGDKLWGQDLPPPPSRQTRIGPGAFPVSAFAWPPP